MRPYRDRYLVSPYGGVYDMFLRKWKKYHVTTRGYPAVSIHGIPVRIHRIVAEAYLVKPEGKDQVDHLDMDKFNNAFYNLEWVTNEENMRRRYEYLRRNGLSLYGVKSGKCGKPGVNWWDLLDRKRSGRLPRTNNSTPCCANRKEAQIITIEKTVRVGKKGVGSGRRSIKLTWEQVQEIKELILANRSSKEIADMFSISRTMVYKIQAGRAWGRKRIA
jgi:hypothetical protein